MSDDEIAEAAWLPDPEDHAMFRYWDGARWTEHRSLRRRPGPRSRVFISYRDEDATADVSAIRLALDARLGPDVVFRDADAIPLAVGWKSEVGKALAETAVVLVVVGPAWSCSAAVEYELRRAIALHVTMLPVFVRGAGAEAFGRQLPNDLGHLAGLTGAELSHRHFERDVDTIASRLRELGATGDASGSIPARWRIESARRSAGRGLMGGEIQLVDAGGTALHLAVRYGDDDIGRVLVNGRAVHWSIPAGVPRRRPPRHGFSFTVFSAGRPDTLELVLEWSGRRAFRRREAPVNLSVSCNGTKVTARRPGRR